MPPARTAIEQCLQVQGDESLVVVTDNERFEIGQALYTVGAEYTDDVVLLQSPPGQEHGAEPLPAIATALRESDVFLAPTTKSLSHTDARREACAKGARGATLPGITHDVFVTGLQADYDSIREECTRIANAVEGAEHIQIRAPAGTDITFEIGTRNWRQDTGIVHAPGDFSNLPAGEVFVSPETANGTYVVDGTIRPHGLVDPDHPVRIRVEDGFAVEIDDQAVAASFERAAESVGDDAYNLAELGIGTNTAVTDLIGSVLLDEKAAGTVHIALGDDASIGGTTNAPIHADGVIRNPSVSVDGHKLTLPGT